ncbi:MAG: Isochorismate synthase [Homoserinimonas sp.]|nr:Isochorismate synthase [Homoserinimonas sp.]
MPTTERPLPSLIVETTPISDPGPLVSLLDGGSPLLWRRRGFGLSGHGVALRLEFSGEHRMSEAAATWRDLVSRASVTDPLCRPGTGLVALASFAFSASSGQSSVLIVPSVIIGRSGDGCWLTRVTTTALPEAALPRIRPLGQPFSAQLVPGRMSAERYTAAVQSAVARIRNHDLSKVVIARDLVGTAPVGADIRHVIAALADGYPDCWTFAVDGFIGSSPETLVAVRAGSVTARVLAGSAARGVDATTDAEAASALATSTKDQDEHEFAVQSVLSSLRPHSPAVTASEVPFTLKLPNLWHLASDIEGTLTDGSTSLDLLSSLHPTAAVAGTPTVDALAVIEELEPFDRGRYAGPVGWVGADGDGEWAIALRSAQLSVAGGITAWAGAGVVAESNPEHELVETRMKFRPIVEAFTRD